MPGAFPREAFLPLIYVLFCCRGCNLSSWPSSHKKIWNLPASVSVVVPFLSTAVCIPLPVCQLVCTFVCPVLQKRFKRKKERKKERKKKKEKKKRERERENDKKKGQTDRQTLDKTKQCAVLGSRKTWNKVDCLLSETRFKHTKG